ncbi:MAG: GNAT family N-acetyltransferase [Anaerolineales bacterium]|nr:GNAT family N-acetyltransferase [Chloroflexota bacterium]MBL6979979.1 GNAT family N-acetyltransferase [Anaerolineales bacterium]
MSKVTIRPVVGDEMLEIAYWMSSYAFRPSPPFPNKEERFEIIRSRKGIDYFALFEDDKPAAVAASTPLSQNVRGSIYQMSGIYNVVTHPAYRRNGYSRQVLAALLATVRDKGWPFTCLYPFRESFYERLGYITFPQPKIAKFAVSTLQPLLKEDLAGEVEIIMIKDGYQAYRDWLYDMQPSVHGMGVFKYGNEAGAAANQSWVAIAREEGEPVGFMLYSLKGEEVTKFNFRAQRFHYKNSLGRYLLLEWIARHIDQANQVEIWLPPFELPETWLADMEVQTEPAWIPPLGRILDVEKIGGMQVGSGNFSAQISDPICPWNEGAWQFESVDGVLEVSKGNDAQCELSINALSALVYGTHDPGDFALRGWGSPPTDLQETMRSMFPSMLPYLHEYY